eukprot:SAG25_NODE_4353_length_835_cov_0.865489_1_plen_132_part_10
MMQSEGRHYPRETAVVVAVVDDMGGVGAQGYWRWGIGRTEDECLQMLRVDGEHVGAHHDALLEVCKLLVAACGLDHAVYGQLAHTLLQCLLRHGMGAVTAHRLDGGRPQARQTCCCTVGSEESESRLSSALE